MSRRLLAALTAVLLLAAGCAGPALPASQTPAARTVDVVRIAWNDVGPPTPFRVSTAGPGGAVLLSLLYDTLTWKDEQGIIPWLATAWEVSPDGRDYTFTLAPGATWHDGQPLTAADVAFSFDYYARHPYRWRSTADVVEGAAVLAPDRVRVRLKQPYAAFVENVAGIVPILPEHVWSGVASPETYDGADASVGSGPYRLAEYRAAEGAYRLTANPVYFRGAPTVREVQQVNIPVETRIQALQQGSVDLVQGSDATVETLFKTNARIGTIATAPLSVVRLAINTARPPLDRVEVRQALAYALDRAQIARVSTKGAPIVGSAGLLPPETAWFNPRLPGYAYDPDRARSLLGGQKLTLELLADPTYREPELLQPMLEAVGITLVTKRVDARTRTQLLREGSFQLGEVQHIGIGADPDLLRVLFDGGEPNDFAQGTLFRDPAYRQLGLEQAATLDPARRKDLVFRMQEMLADQLPTIPLFYRRFYWAYDRTRYTPMNTAGGLMDGIPFVQNKLTFLAR